MALSTVQTVTTYRSFSGAQSYYFDVVIDAQGLVSIRNIKTPVGLLQDSSTPLPQSVLDDMTTATEIAQVRDNETAVTGGIVVFTGQTEQLIAVVPGLLNNTNYRVAYTPPDGISFHTANKSTTSFSAVVGTNYGSLAEPKNVGYTVLTNTAQASVFGGAITFTAADLGQKAVPFPTAFTTAGYRVVTSPGGFFPVRVTSQTKQGFTLQLGMLLKGAETVEVGYDVFV